MPSPMDQFAQMQQDPAAAGGGPGFGPQGPQAPPSDPLHVVIGLLQVIMNKIDMLGGGAPQGPPPAGPMGA